MTEWKRRHGLSGETGDEKANDHVYGCFHGGGEAPVDAASGFVSSRTRTVEGLLERLRLQHSDLRRTLTLVGGDFAQLLAQNNSDAELEHLATAFNELRSVVIIHSGHEERVVFSAVRAPQGSARPAELEKTIDWLRAEHRGLMQSLDRIRRIVDGYALRDPSFDALRRNVERFSTELTRHVSDEESLLYPRVLEEPREPGGAHK